MTEPKSEWPCEHTIKVGKDWKIFSQKDIYEISGEWKFCPICSAQRPEPKKELWELIKEAWPLYATDTDYKVVADTAHAYYAEELKKNEEFKRIRQETWDKAMATFRKWYCETPEISGFEHFKQAKEADLKG